MTIIKYIKYIYINLTFFHFINSSDDSVSKKLNTEENEFNLKNVLLDHLYFNTFGNIDDNQTETIENMCTIQGSQRTANSKRNTIKTIVDETNIISKSQMLLSHNENIKTQNKLIKNIGTDNMNISITNTSKIKKQVIINTHISFLKT